MLDAASVDVSAADVVVSRVEVDVEVEVLVSVEVEVDDV